MNITFHKGLKTFKIKMETTYYLIYAKSILTLTSAKRFYY
jgi:hypothetical protein